MVVNGGRGKPRAANLHCRPDLSRPLRMSPTDILTLTRGTIPLLVSFPHAGTDIPPSIARRMTPAALLRADTDWHLRGALRHTGTGRRACRPQGDGRRRR